MLKNGTFTELWDDMLPPAPGNLINQQPKHWTLKWLELGESLYDDPGSQVRGIPECVHKLARQLPPNEQLGQPNALILAGDTTYKIFHGATTFGATLSQTVTGLEPGSTAVLTVPIQVHMHGATDPFSAESGVWVNGEGGWVNGGDMGDREWFRHKLTFTVPADGTAEIVIRVKSKWPQPKDFFFDGITLEAAEGEPEEPPQEPTVTQQILDLLDGSTRSRVILKLKEKVGNGFVERARFARTLSNEAQLEIIIRPQPMPKSVGGLALEAAPPGLALNAPDPNSGQRVLGMDVSWAQGKTTNFEKAAEMGVKYCFIRVASGRTKQDDNFNHNYTEAGRAGMLRGIYYYLYPEAQATVGSDDDKTPEGQARRFATLLHPDAELGAVLDVEADGLTVDEVRRFVDTFQAADPYNRPIMIYTAAWFWNAARGFSGTAVDWSTNHPLWVAHYTSDSEPIKPANTFQVAIPSPWPNYAFHQWTSVGGSLADQAQVGLDLNYFPGSLTELRAWARQDAQPFDDGIIGAKFITATAGLNLRDQPTTASNILTLMPHMARVDVLQEGPWDQIRFEGQVGFASSEFLSTENPRGAREMVETFEFKVWPTGHKTVTQFFGERPQFYFDLTNGFLPGHEGVDLKAPFGDPYFCVAPGKVVKVSDKKDNGEPSAYGWHVVVQHQDGYSTLYAHAAADTILVKPGDNVMAGQILAHSGNTGESSAPHLHITLQKEGHQTPGPSNWPPKYMDPWSFLEPLFSTLTPPTGNLTEGFLFASSMDIRANNLAVAKQNLNMRERPTSASRLIAKVPPNSVVRLLTTVPDNGYLLCEAAVDLEEQPGRVRDAEQPEKLDLLPYVRGTGRQYEVRNAAGGQERFRAEHDGTIFYQVKNAQWEQMFFDGDFIYRDIDTSPGGGRYYRLTDPDRSNGSRWLRREMALGEIYTQARKVQFFKKADGTPSDANSGDVTDTIKLVAHHPQLELRSGEVVVDIIELHWVNGPNNHDPREKYFYGRDFGLVAWERGHQDPNSPAWSALSEVHDPGTRPPIPREVVMIR